ncbi:PaaI family thioesterase [Aeromicrobium sp.]|uniref:PaaI family thioesterase n=1 Tax=Aeromicrobium sp. TaxID=1871063 RepID=UPI002FC62C0B
MSDDVEPSVIARAMEALNAGDLETATILNRELVRLHDRMGITIVGITEDSAETTMELNADTAGSRLGTVHGGMLATFADVTAALALTRSLDGTGHIQVTTDMHIRYFRQPKSGPLTARATVVHRGRLILSAECVICDAEGRDLARATATYMLAQLPS